MSDAGQDSQDDAILDAKIEAVEYNKYQEHYEVWEYPYE